jgi:hypothetical protein
MILVKGMLRTQGPPFGCWRDIRKAKAALFAVRRGRTMKLYVIPTAQLRNVASVYIPADGNYDREQQETTERLDTL